MKHIKLTLIFILYFFNIKFIKSQDLSDLKNTKPISLSGGINVQTGFYGMKGANARQPGFTYMLNGSPTLNVYGVSLPFSFTFSNFQRDFRQPFNQFGLSPTYKWITVHAGYRNISYSQFGMAGYTLLGGGIELKPKKFKLSVLYGRSQKAIQDDTSKKIESSLNGINYPAYKRMLTSVNFGYGTTDNYIDINFLRGKDDSSSLPFRPITQQINPSKNQVYSVKTQLSFFKKKLIYQAEGAVSAYTRDLGFETIDAGNNLVNKLVKANISTQLYSAFETQLNYNASTYGLGIKYRKVAPDYKSMGAYFFQSDFEQLLLNGKFNAFKSKLRLNGSFGQQKDNLQKKKFATTIRNVYNATVSLAPNEKWGIDAVISNYGTSQRAGTRNLSDTAQINQINSAITITPRYTKIKEKTINNYLLILGKQSLDDRNRITEIYTNVNMLFANLLWSKSMLKTNVNYNTGLNYNQSETRAGKIALYGVIAGVSKSWKNGKYNMDLNSNFNATSFNDKQNGINASVQYSAGMKMGKKHKLQFLSNYMLNQSKDAAAGSDFSEYFVRINYGFSF